jgi:uncharacterized protein (TIGR02246 family)
MRYRMMAALAVSVALAACGGGPKEQAFTRADTDTIRKTAADLAAAYAAKNVEAAVDLFSPDAVFMPPNAPTLRGKDAIRTFFTKRFAENVQLRLEPQDVGGHGPIAFQSGTYSLTIERPGAAPVRDRGKYLFVSKLLNGKWLFEQTMWSSDLPPAANAQS